MSLSQNFPPPGEGAPLCECGCGQPVKWNKRYHRWNRFINYHTFRVFQWGMIKDKGEPPLCKCGCGQKVSWNTNKGQWREYCWGHNALDPSRREPRLCACGCGEPTPQKVDGTYTEFKKGHWNCINGVHDYTKYQREYNKEHRQELSIKARERYRERKLFLLSKIGQECAICRFDQYVSALTFHHKEPTKKTRAADYMKASFTDFDNLITLCFNCHMALEAGELELPWNV